jgi:ParB-like chromosome segregation protein Spo0J
MSDLKLGMKPTTVPNVSMIATGPADDIRRRPNNIHPIGIYSIHVGQRERRLDKEKVEALAKSFLSEGLLQPIGVRQRKPSGSDLIYGHHRLAAAILNHERGLTETSSIAAVVFPANMPDWACKLAEVAENLIRKDLTPKQREAETAIYAGLLKKHGLVTDANTARSEAKKNVENQGSDPHHVGHLPTTTEKVAADIGISDEQVRRRISNAVKTAERVGVTVESKKTPEKMSGDDLIKVGAAAADAAESDRKEALERDVDPRKINPHQPVGETVTMARLDIIDPQPFIDWCRNRIKGKHKPMSLEVLKAYRKALDDLIAEVEST